MNITELTVHELLEKLKNKELTVTEITKAYIDRINEKEKDVQAFITPLTDEAMKKAEEIDKKIEAGEEAELRDYAIARIEKEIPYCRLNGDRTRRLPNNINFSFRFVEGESLLIMLDMKGICASSGSACTSGSLDPSHVLLAIGLPHEIAHGSLRMTLSAETTKEDIDYTIDNLKEIVAHLRSMSPLYEDFMRKQK